MEGLQQILPINGAMNMDDDARYVRSSEGQVVERVNLRPNSIDGNRWLNRKIKGNELISIETHTGLPFVLPQRGENKCIGWCKDYQSDAIIYFIYNSLSWHCILRYYQKEKSIEKIWYERPELGFEDTIIKAFVADKMLYWCNGEQPLKSFIIDWAVKYHYPAYTVGDDKSYSDLGAFDLEEVIFPMCKRPPRYAPSLEYTNVAYDEYGTEINFNNLRRNMFQFKYKYTYLDGQESAWSPISKVGLPPFEVSVYGDWDTDITTNNGIIITYDTGSNYVKKITIAGREVQDRTALGDFFTIEEIDKYDNEGERVEISSGIPFPDDELNTLTFLNTKKLENINTEINNRYCDDIPLSASDILLLDGKYSTLAMPVKGYDLIDVDYDLEVHETEIITTNDVYVMNIDVWTRYLKFVYLPSFQASSTYSITLSVDGHGSFTATYTTGANEPANYPFVVADSLATDLDPWLKAIKGSSEASVDGSDDSKIKLYLSLFAFEDLNVVAEVQLASSLGQPVYKNLKRCHYHPFVIIYNDGFGRYNIAQGDKELYVPQEECGDVYYATSCKMSINNKPPIWAKTYRIGYLPSKSYTWFLQLPFVRCYKNEDLEQDAGDYNLWKYEIPENYYFLKINQAITRWQDKYPNLAVPAYTFQEGDRIRSVCHKNTYEILKEYAATVTEQPVGSPPVTAEVTGYLVRINTTEDIVDSDYTVNLLEIYRPNSSLSSTGGTITDTASYNNLFWEIGEEFDILDYGTDERRHGITQNGELPLSIPLASLNIAQTLDINDNPLTPAILYLYFGDTYLRGRMGVEVDGSETASTIEDLHYTDFFTSSGIDIGRITAKIDSEQKELNSIVRSEQFIEGSLINWLNVFLFSTVHFDASDIYGRIIGIEEMGGTLKVIQEHKEGSIMIGQVTEKQADFGDWIFIGDTVFGAYRRYEEDRGSVYRRSIAENRRYLYYFDESTGEFIRSSPNGQAPISKEYNMQNWFEKKAKAIREYSGSKDVITAFDNDYEEVVVSFIMEREIETVVFSEKEGFKGWTYFGTYFNDDDFPEDFATFKDNLISFLNGQLYLHGNGLLNTFYGKLHGCSIKIPVNQYASVMKRFSSIRVSTDNNLWYTEFNIPEGVNYQAQKSSLVPAIMREKENALYSDILRNIINRAGVEDINLIHNGNRMVGESMEVTLSDSTDDDVNLGTVQVNFLIAK